MKKIELNNLGRKVLKVLTWLLTVSVVSTLGILGTGWFGALTFYLGMLFLAFVYFKDEDLQNTIKNALVVAVIFVVISLAINVYSDALVAFDVEKFNGVELAAPYKFVDILEFLFKTAKYLVFSVFILMDLFKKDAVETQAKEKTEE